AHGWWRVEQARGEFRFRTELGGHPLAFRCFRLNGARRGRGYRHAAGRAHDPPRTLRRLLLHALRRQPRDNLTAAGGRPKYGGEVLAQVRTSNPGAYVRVVASIPRTSSFSGRRANTTT